MAIAALLVNKTATEKAQIKAKEIAKLNFVGKHKIGDIEMEIQSLTEIEGGIEVYARAWKGGKQLGFGDGTVDIERFRIFNPPALIDDPLGTIIREYINSLTGVLTKRTLREDPFNAVLISLSHTVSVSGKLNTEIIKGSVGHTTNTYYPDAHTETNTVDGQLGQTGNTTDWLSLVDGAGNYADDTDWRMTAGYECTAGGNYWLPYRIITLFNTADLTSGATISSATYSLYGQAIANSLGASLVINVYSSAPASNTALVAGDFDSLGTTAFCDSGIAVASITTSGYNNFALNASGLAAISKTSITKLGSRDATYDVGRATPPRGASGTGKVIFYSADQTGTANDPKLVVTFTTGGTTINHSNLLTLGVG